MPRRDPFYAPLFGVTVANFPERVFFWIFLLSDSLYTYADRRGCSVGLILRTDEIPAIEYASWLLPKGRYTLAIDSCFF